MQTREQQAADAVVTATYGTRMRLRRSDGRSVAARVKGKKLRPVCGDRVSAEPIPGEEDWLVTSIGPRDNELTRPDARGRTEVLAANLDFLAVTCAPVPKPDWYVVDRYLGAAELMGIGAGVVYNKVDQGAPAGAAAAELDGYRELGYPVVICSAETGQDVDELAALLAGHTAIIVGQSGVGKSSLIGAITHTELKTAEISTARGEGRHTTVSSVMLELPQGGYVVDSPGVRDYAPFVANPADVGHGFREVRRLAADCRFANCRHRREPDCAVKRALETGGISERRYDSYRRLLNLAEQQEKRSSTRRPAE